MPNSFLNTIGNFRDKVLDKNWKKMLVAVILTVLFIGGLGFAYIWTNPSLKQSLFGPKYNNVVYNSNSVILSQADLDLLNYNPVETLIKKKTVKELPIFPKSYQKQYFSDVEIKDSSLSGPQADFDKDGLTNKEEYIYASNPKNPDTLGAGGKDSEYVQAGKNPLSGLPLDNIDFAYYFVNSDLAILEETNNDLDVLEEEGIHIPVLYEQARTKDYSEDLKQISLNVIDNPNRDDSITYLNKRLLLLKDTVASNYLDNLSKIYQTKDKDVIAKLKLDNTSRVVSLQSMAVPKQEADIHQSMIYFFQQIDKLIDLRGEVIEKGLERKDYDTKQDEIILRSVWAYRKINDTVNKLNPNN